MKKFKTLLVSAIAALTMGAACAFAANAEGETVEDVYDALRDIGFNEYMIQICRTQFEQYESNEEGVYDEEGSFYTYGNLVASVYQLDFLIWDTVGAEFGVSGEELKEYVAAMENQTTTTVTTTTTGNGSGGTTTTTTTTTTTQPLAKDPNTGKLFINMTLEEKKAYVQSLPEAERVAFLASLTPDERNSIIKQMSTDSKAVIADGFVSMGQDLGMNITVNDITDDKIDVSIRDNAGTLINDAAIGVIVEDTGWNLTAPIAIAGTMVLLSVGGIGWVMYRTGRKTEEETDG